MDLAYLSNSGRAVKWKSSGARCAGLLIVTKYRYLGWLAHSLTHCLPQPAYSELHRLLQQSIHANST